MTEADTEQKVFADSFPEDENPSSTKVQLKTTSKLGKVVLFTPFPLTESDEDESNISVHSAKRMKRSNNEKNNVTELFDENTLDFEGTTCNNQPSCSDKCKLLPTKESSMCSSPDHASPPTFKYITHPLISIMNEPELSYSSTSPLHSRNSPEFLSSSPVSDQIWLEPLLPNSFPMPKKSPQYAPSSQNYSPSPQSDVPTSPTYITSSPPYYSPLSPSYVPSSPRYIPSSPTYIPPN